MYHEFVGTVIAPAHNPDAAFCRFSAKAADPPVHPNYALVPALSKSDEERDCQGVAILGLHGKQAVYGSCGTLMLRMCSVMFYQARAGKAKARRGPQGRTDGEGKTGKHMKYSKSAIKVKVTAPGLKEGMGVFERAGCTAWTG